MWLSLLCWVLGMFLSLFVGFDAPVAAKPQPGIAVPEQSACQLWWYIFRNNALLSLLIALGGIFTFGLLTASVLFANGYLFARVLLPVVRSEEISLIEAGKSLLHAPFELYAIFWFGAIGFSSCQFLFGQNREKSILEHFELPGVRHVIIPLIVLLFASLLEAASIWLWSPQ